MEDVTSWTDNQNYNSEFTFKSTLVFYDGVYCDFASSYSLKSDIGDGDGIVSTPRP